MKRFFSVILCVALMAVSVFSLSSCSSAKDIKYDVVFITDGGTVTDGAYNESAWKGISAYAEEAGKSCRYYQPILEDDKLSLETALNYIDIAVESGAEFIVLPTEKLEAAAYEAAKKYTDIKFILADGTLHSAESSGEAVLPNVMNITFDELQSGFLAGYNAVIAGNFKLGYFGSYNSESSKNYGAGFVQGAEYAASQLRIPAILEYADYDSPVLDYDYSFTITANYSKIEDVDDNTYKINVVNGIGSGVYTEGSNVTLIANPAPQGKVFDKWEAKSDTNGVKDSKVNLSTKSKTTTNLLVEECDATITAVYKDAESTTYPVTVMNAENTAAFSTQYIVSGSSCEVKAPAAKSGMVFDHWDISTKADGIIDDIHAKSTWVHMGEEGITLVPVYTESPVPTFDVTVVTGEGGNGESTGSGSYVTGDLVSVSAALPEDGYIFTSWSNADKNGYGAGISMANEYYPVTSFNMVNRYQSVAETMYDEGVSIIYAGGNDECNVVSDATWKYNYLKQAIGAENWQAGWDHYYSTTIKEYGNAIKACLADFKGGTNYIADCSNNGISMTFVDKENQENYDAVFKSLADKVIQPVAVANGETIEDIFNSKYLTLDYWVVD